MDLHNVAIALPLEETLLHALHDWGKKFDFSQVHNVSFIHIVKKNITPLEFGLVEYPDDHTFHDMVPALKKFLEDEAQKIIPKDYHGKIHYMVTKDFHPEEEVIDLLKATEANLVVVASKGKQGLENLFRTSFSDYMVKHSPCDVMIVRPEEEIKKSA